MIATIALAGAALALALLIGYSAVGITLALLERRRARVKVASLKRHRLAHAERTVSRAQVTLSRAQVRTQARQHVAGRWTLDAL
jgi:hypothetical protein